jgi:hypothetical protein
VVSHCGFDISADGYDVGNWYVLIGHLLSSLENFYSDFADRFTENPSLPIETSFSLPYNLPSWWHLAVLRNDCHNYWADIDILLLTQSTVNTGVHTSCCLVHEFRKRHNDTGPNWHVTQSSFTALKILRAKRLQPRFINQDLIVHMLVAHLWVFLVYNLTKS